MEPSGTPEDGRPSPIRPTEWVLTGSAMLFLAAYATTVLGRDLPSVWLSLCESLMWLAWAVFLLDFGNRLLRAERRAVFLRAHVGELLVVLVPMFRPLQPLRLVYLLHLLNRNARTSLRGQVAGYVAVATALVVFVASLAALDQERDAPGANITTFGDALWWALATITTVGYGDLYPVTGGGKLVAAALMLSGIALLGIVTASFASWLIARVAEVEEESEAVTRRDIAALAEEVRSLRHQLLSHQDGSGRPSR